MKERWQIPLILWCLELSMAKAQMVSMNSPWFQLDPNNLRLRASFEMYFACQTGGIMSSFLMGCYDPESRKWCTVTKCSGGYDDATLARLQKDLDVIKIGKVNLKT